MSKYSKFSTSEIIIGGLSTLCVDGISALLDLTVIGIAISIPLQAGTSLGTTLWVASKGGKRAFGIERQIIKQAANFSPFIPTTFIAFVVETKIHNNPGLAKAASVKTPTKSVAKPGSEMSKAWAKAAGVKYRPPPEHEISKAWAKAAGVKYRPAPEHEISKAAAKAAGVKYRPPPEHEISKAAAKAAGVKYRPPPEHEASKTGSKAAGVKHGPAPEHEASKTGSKSVK